MGGGVWKDSEDADCIASNGTTCWKCSPPRWALDERFAYSFFSYLWHSAFMVALSQCIVAGAVGAWFFAPKGDKMTTWSLGIGIKNAVLWHTGSLAFGSFILAVVQFIRWFLYWLKKQSEAQGNIVMVYVCKILGCLVWCFEKCVKLWRRHGFELYGACHRLLADHRLDWFCWLLHSRGDVSRCSTHVSCHMLRCHRVLGGKDFHGCLRALRRFYSSLLHRCRRNRR